jgi:hypothetical protein
MTMDHFLCATCGTQFPRAPAPPPACPICDDERQYVPAAGQRWTTLSALRRSHTNAWREYEPGLLGIGTVPAFAIGQRALLVRTPRGNVLWDCISLLDDATITLVRALGGVAAIAISHPHYYSSMADWAQAFDAPVWLHEADRAHVVQPGPHLRFWSGDTHELLPGLTLVNTPGHFDGAAMLHWAEGAAGAGCLLSGDIFQVGPDRHVSFMRSYPNLIPLPARAVRLLDSRMAPFAYDRVYGAWWDRAIPGNAKAIVAASVARYLRWIEG